jgi:hypothetical protein
MNCREFENIVNDLSREHLRQHLMDAALRARGLDHTRDCARCAARLADERALTAGLRAVAADDDGACPSIRIETELLAAFHQNTATKTKPLHAIRVPRWALAAAAAIVIALGFVVSRELQVGPAGNKLAGGNQSSYATPTPAAPSPEFRRPDSQDDISAVQKIIVENPKSRLIANRTKGRPGRRGSNERVAVLEPRQILIRDGMTLYANTGDGEVTSDFLPLTYSSSSPPVERGQLIRVQMPRSALLKFGLPMNVEQANMPVKADLLVGEDGLAHAIRFVR